MFIMHCIQLHLAALHRFEDYINKSFNKTASLMAYSCQANAVLAEATEQEVGILHTALLGG